MTWSIAVRVGVALLPLTLVPLLVWLIANGHLDLGGGEKDLVIVVLWFLWSVIFALSCFSLWRRGWSHRRTLLRSAVVSFVGLLCVLLVLALFGQLGVGGVF